jgi:hypothetical protein
VSLPPCVRCGHPFERHRSWNICADCECPGYRGTVPLTRETVRAGDRLELVMAARGGIAGANPIGTVTAVDDAGIVVAVDGDERRVSWEQARTGHVRRPG